MTQRRASLRRNLLKSLLLPGVIAAIVGVLIVYSLTKEEYDELQDLGLIGKAELLSHLITSSTAPNHAALFAFEDSLLEPEERTLFWLLDASDTIIAHTPNAPPALLPSDLSAALVTQNSHRYAIATADSGETVVVGVSLSERNEAIFDVLTGVVLGFLLLGLLFAALVFLSARKSVGIVARLSNNIASKNEHDLSPIDRANAFAEIDPAIDTLNALMARLDTALAAERAFATNAAHELRTPVAVSLAHAQRLKAKLDDPALAKSAGEIEEGLKRLVRLTERLLQMSRAQSGLGTSPAASDVRPVVSLLLKELRQREPSKARLVLHEPTDIWASTVDRDALGIILNNLFDNALKYASGPAPTVVDARTNGQITVSNDCAALAPADLAAIKERFMRKGTHQEGFGLGLSIVQQLCDQSGCTLGLSSPLQSQQRGFMAVLTLPLAERISGQP